MRKTTLLAIILALALVLAACGGGGGSQAPAQTPDNAGNAEAGGDQADEPPVSTVRVGMVTDIGGINDQSFNQSAWEGFLRAQTDFGVDIAVLESRTDADYLTNFETLVDDGRDLIVGVGFRMGDAIRIAAEHNPDVMFAIIDFAYSPEEVPNNNLNGVLFRVNEASFLVGVIAGLTTESNIIGFVNGMDSPVMHEFGVGFYAGVLTVNPEAEVLGQFANNFADPALGRAIANMMYSDGADVIFHAAGDTGNGVIEAAREHGRWVIGVDMDQHHLAPDNVLSSAMKRVDIATYELIQSMVEGTFVGGSTIIHDLVTGGVGIAPSSNIHVAPDVLALVAEKQAEIISGEIVVPNTQEEFLAAFPGTAYMNRT